MNAEPSAQPKRDFGGLDPAVADTSVESLRLGEVPDIGLDVISTGIDEHLAAFEREFLRIESGSGRIRFLQGFFHAAIDRWVHRAAERASDPTIGGGVSETSPDFGNAVDAQLRVMLCDLFDRAPSFAQALAGYAHALDEERVDVSRRLLQWLAGDSHVAAGVKKYANLPGALREDDALPMLAGLVTVLEQIGVRGLVVLIDDVERVLRQPQPATRMAAYMI